MKLLTAKDAEKIVEFFKKDSSIQKILEPSCGDGVFVDALIETRIFFLEI